MKLYRVRALLLKYMYTTRNSVDRIFDIFYWPVIDIVVWGFASFYITSLSDVNVISMLLGGIILWSFVWRATQDLSVYVLDDFWSDTLYHVYSSPLKVNEIILGLMLFGFLRGVTTFTVMAILAYILYSVNVLAMPWLFLAIAISILNLFGFAMGLFVTSFIMRFGKRIQVIAWSSVWIMQPFACVFYPLSTLPNSVQVVAKVLPITYVFENMRSALNGAAINYGQLSYSLFATIIFLVLMSVVLVRSFVKARESGLLARGD